jgi:hypothetical protein
MKWIQFKEIATKEFAVKAMGALYLVIKLIDKIQKEDPKDVRMYKLETKHHHIRLIQDSSFATPCMLVKQKGLLKEWRIIDKTDMPECLVEDIFEESCSDEKRKHLINKMMKLKAFW